MKTLLVLLPIVVLIVLLILEHVDRKKDNDAFDAQMGALAPFLVAAFIAAVELLGVGLYALGHFIFKVW